MSDEQFKQVMEELQDLWGKYKFLQIQIDDINDRLEEVGDRFDEVEIEDDFL